MKIPQIRRQAKVALHTAGKIIFSLCVLSISVHAYEFQVPKSFCLLSGSANTTAESLGIVQAVLTNRLAAKCEIIQEAWSSPFHEIQKYSSSPEKPVFIFWVDRDTKTSDLLVRGLDAASGLQWGIVTARVEGLSAGSQRAVLEDAISRLVKQFPFVGMMQGQNFFVWALEDMSHLQFFKIKSSERHPFLPQILSFSRDTASKPGWSIQQDEGSWTLVAPAKPGLSAKSDQRLWLGLSTH